MGKYADKYYRVDPWSIIEDDFDCTHGLESESAFSLGNEYMGVRGYFEEGYSRSSQIGSFFNGFYEETPIYHPARYKGFVDISRDMTNAVDWLYTRILIDGEQLDLATSRFEQYNRRLSFKAGSLKRSFLWLTQSGKQLKISFERLLSMNINYIGCQRIIFEAVNFSGEVTVVTGLDFTPHAAHFLDSNWEVLAGEKDGEVYSILGQTKRSKLRLYSSFRIDCPERHNEKEVTKDRFVGCEFKLNLEQEREVKFDKIVVNYAAKKADDPESIWLKGKELVRQYSMVQYNDISRENRDYWEKIWKSSDITIEGDPENQQGIRFCIFQLHQTYRGSDPSLNIGAKGLSGEAYGGKAFWDTEAYCLQFYIFNNPEAAKTLLSYRYNLLNEARERAKELDCEGACYPISTIDGIETCGAWQHSSLQIHVSGSIAYGIYNYDKICQDKDFLYTKGIEMLLEISRFYKSRVQQNPLTGEYGYYGVMGVDEFHMMVNNNCFTNYLAKKAMSYTIDVVNEMKQAADQQLQKVVEKLQVTQVEINRFIEIAEHIYLPKNDDGLYEQHDGFFVLPHIDLASIPVEDFPLYNYWSYDRIYRTDMIKQADVLMMLFMYSNDFSNEVKKINYEYYEPKCIHESSLSPSVHSILASEIGNHKEAYEFFRFATRLDLDNYNRNTKEGLHLTSIAAAWMNIVYGFGGMRTEEDQLNFRPTIPGEWKFYRFSLIYQGDLLQITVSTDEVLLQVEGDKTLSVRVYGVEQIVNRKGISIPIPSEYKNVVA